LKARALCIAEIQSVLNDAAAPPEATAPPDELPPRLAADTTPEGEARAHRHMQKRALTAADLAAIEAAVDKLKTRIDALEQKRRAYDALLEAEQVIEQELGIDPEDEDEPATWN
jgi:hypothetical protein